MQYVILRDVTMHFKHATCVWKSAVQWIHWSHVVTLWSSWSDMYSQPDASVSKTSTWIPSSNLRCQVRHAMAPFGDFRSSFASLRRGGGGSSGLDLDLATAEFHSDLVRKGCMIMYGKCIVAYHGLKKKKTGRSPYGTLYGKSMVGSWWKKLAEVGQCWSLTELPTARDKGVSGTDSLEQGLTVDLQQPLALGVAVLPLRSFKHADR